MTHRSASSSCAVLLTLLLCCCVVVSHVEAAAIAVPRAHDYPQGGRVPLTVVKLDSVRTQIAYRYYSLPFCRPAEIREYPENLGEVLSGDVVEDAPFEVNMGVNEKKVICAQKYTAAELAQLAQLVKDEYRVEWQLDDMPVGTRYTIPDEVDEKGLQVLRLEKGFPLGFIGSPEITGSTPHAVYVNNHIKLTVYTHSEEQAQHQRVVGVEVEPQSRKQDATESKGKWALKAGGGTEFQKISGDEGSITWTYEVQFVRAPPGLEWANRWDLYLRVTNAPIHGFSITNSLIVVIFLTGMVAMILIRSLRKDLARYNEMEQSPEEEKEESGWKLVHGDVFRPPAQSRWLCVLIGSGVQLMATAVITLALAVAGFLSPANRGGLLSTMLLTLGLTGMAGGYCSTRLYKGVFKQSEWRVNVFWTSFAYPALMFLIFLAIDFMLWSKHSSGAIPFKSVLAILVLWFGISMPLVYIGSYAASRADDVAPPCKVNNIPRASMPDRPWYSQPLPAILLGGVLPFGSVFIEIFFIMSSVWLHQYYYMFAVLSIVFVILVVTCAEVSIVMCYFQLCAEDYHWWWRSFFSSASSALYLALYAIYFLNTSLQLTSWVSVWFYLGYMTIAVVGFACVTGTIGFAACFFFVRTIYASVKID